MAKGAKLKITKLALKKLILKLSVDTDGRKVSDRVLWGSEEFMDKSGLFKENKYTKEIGHCSLGTISYYKKLLKLNAMDTFTHHQMVTGKIHPLTTFGEWNLKTNVKSMDDNVVSDKAKKTKLIRDFDLKDGAYYNTYTLAELENAIIELYNELGMDGVEELRLYYKGE